MSFPTGFLRGPALALGMLAVLGSMEHAARDESGSGFTQKEQLIAVSRVETDKGQRWSVLCDKAPLEELLRAIARKSGLALEGVELLPLGATVSIELERRPLEQILAFVLGNQGLRHELVEGTVRLLPPSHDSAELLRMAQEAWRSVEAEGDERAAARAKLARGNLAEVRGDLEGAYHLYSEIAAEDLGEEGAEATFRAGRILEQLGHWAEAAQHFRTLAGMEIAKGFHSRARLELARASIELGDAQSALHLLNFLEAHYETRDATELAERRLVRARAFNAVNEYVEALRVLEEGQIIGASMAEARSLSIRATAFEGLGFEVEAARAWLIYAREAASKEERNGAFEKAASLSLAGGDELGALFVCREAAKSGNDEGLGSIAHKARLRLGLDEEEAPTSMQERLEHAERLFAEGEVRKASALFEGLYLARGAFSEGGQARILVGWSHILLDRAGLQAAIEILSQARAALEDPDVGRALDLAAAELFESEGLFEEASEAYRGNY